MASLNDHYIFLITLTIITVFNQHFIAAQNERNRPQSAEPRLTQPQNPSGRPPPPPEFQFEQMPGSSMSSDRSQQGRSQAPPFNSDFQSNFRPGPPPGDFQFGRPPPPPRDDGFPPFAGALERNVPEFSKDSRSDRYSSPDSQSDRYSSSFPRNSQYGNNPPPPPPPPHFARNQFSSMTPSDMQSENRFPQFRSPKSPSSSDYQFGPNQPYSSDFPSDFSRPPFGPPPPPFDMRFGPPPPFGAGRLGGQGGWQNENDEFGNSGHRRPPMDNESAGYGDRGMQPQQVQRPPGPKQNAPPTSTYN